jgi:magnesium-protoporphyrin O-methyltransferase
MPELAPSADVTILDKVICCYENARELIARSAAKTRRIYAVSYPRESALIKLFMRIGIAIAELFRLSFHPYYHDPRQIQNWITANGLEKVYQNETFIWLIQVYKRK